MTHRQRRSLAKYVCQIAVTLGLRDWTLQFPEEPPDTDDAMAAVDCVYGRRIASVYFCTDFADMAPEMQRNAVVHELVHVHFAQERQAVNDGLDALGRDARTVAHAAYRLGHEYGVDAIADAIAPFFPLWEGK